MANTFTPVQAYTSLLQFMTPEAMRRGDVQMLLHIVLDKLNAPDVDTTDLERENGYLKDKIGALESMIALLDSGSEPTPEPVVATKRGRKKSDAND